MNSYPKKPYQRKLRNFLIYPRFQLGLLGIQATIMIATFAIAELENRSIFSNLTQEGLASGIDPNHAYFRFLDEQSHTFFHHTVLAFAAGLVLSSVVTLYLSFRLAGPIYRLRKHMRQIAAGGTDGLEPLRFRNGDFYSDLPAAVNQAVDRLKNGKGGSA